MESAATESSQKPSKLREHDKLSTRLYSVDIIRSVCIIGMTLLHSLGSSIDIGTILTKYQVFIPLLVILAAFSQFRGFFLYVTGTISVYRLGSSLFTQLLGVAHSQKQPQESIARTYLLAMKGPILQLCTTALIWPLLYIIDSIRLLGEQFRQFVHASNDFEHYIPADLHFGAEFDADPVSAVFIANALLCPAITLFLIAAHAITRRIRFKSGRVRGKRANVFSILAYDEAAAMVAITGGFLLVLSLVTALTRVPFDRSVARTVAREFRRLNVPGSERMCAPDNMDKCTIRGSYLYDGVDVTHLFYVTRGQERPEFRPGPYFMAAFARQMCGSLMGFSPFAINYMAGAFMGLLLALFKRSSSKLKDDAPSTQLSRHEMACVLWVWNALYLAVLAVAFAIWLGVVPYTPWGTYHPNGYNGPNVLEQFDIHNKDGKSLVTERLDWHTGAYELELTVLQIVCGTALVYWCEFTRAACKMCREDGAHYGTGPFVLYRRKQHVPGRFFRHFSTYSATVFYFFDSWVYTLVIRFAQIKIPGCTDVCRGPSIFFPFFIMPILVILFVYLVDCTYGFLSIDFLISLVVKVGTLVMTAIIMPLFSVKRIRKDAKGFAKDYAQALLAIVKSVYEKPLYLQHTAVRAERLYPLELDESGQGVPVEVSLTTI